MTKYAPYSVLLTYESVERTNIHGRKFIRKEPRITVYESANEALRQHALAYKRGEGGMLEIEPPITDAIDFSFMEDEG